MDLNHRPPGPEPGALARLRYAPTDPLRVRLFVPSRTFRLAQLDSLEIELLLSPLAHPRASEPSSFSCSFLQGLSEACVFNTFRFSDCHCYQEKAAGKLALPGDQFYRVQPSLASNKL